MAKVNALFGKATGKVGALVFQVNSGTQIMKEKPAKVSNPQTDAQVEQRAKLKLMSQLAAALSRGLGFKKQGLVSARNQFISKNLPLCEYENDTATVILHELIIAPGEDVISGIMASRTSATKGTAQISPLAEGTIDRAIYVVAVVTDTEKLRLVSITSAEAGAGNTFDATIDIEAGRCVVFAYGVKFTSSSAKVKFNDYIASANYGNASLGAFLPTLLSAGVTTLSIGTDISASA